MNQFNRELLQKLSYQMDVKNYSQKTIKSYISCLSDFFNYCQKQSKDISKNDFINYLECKKSIGKLGNSFHNQFINAWRIYLKLIHNKYLKYGNEYRPRKIKKLPNVLTLSEIINGIKKCNNKKHIAIMATLASTGIRMSELLNLKVFDIDSKLMIIHIRQGKGFKDGKVPLSESLLKILRNYAKEYKPKYWLFEGLNGKYSSTSVNNILKLYLGKNISAHKIRHSMASNMISCGADISEVQAQLRHNSIKTTQIYLHINIDRLHKFDNLKMLNKVC